MRLRPTQNDQMSRLSPIPAANQPDFLKEKFFGLPLMSPELLWMTFFQAEEMQLLKKEKKTFTTLPITRSLNTSVGSEPKLGSAWFLLMLLGKKARLGSPYLAKQLGSARLAL